MVSVAASTGEAAERQAWAYLQGQGLVLVQRHYRMRGGEIDLVARDGAVLVFVEVRWRASAACGGAAASVDARKQRRLLLAARHYLMRHGDDASRCRFDVVAIDGGRLQWIRDAFDAGS